MDVKAIWEKAQTDFEQRNTLNVHAWNEYCPELLEALQDLVAISGGKFKFALQNQSDVRGKYDVIATNLHTSGGFLPEPNFHNAWFIVRAKSNDNGQLLIGADTDRYFLDGPDGAYRRTAEQVIAILARTITNQQDYSTTIAQVAKLKS